MTTVLGVMLTLLFGLLLFVQGMSDTLAAAPPFIEIELYSSHECEEYCIQVSKESSGKFEMQLMYRKKICKDVTPTHPSASSRGCKMLAPDTVDHVEINAELLMQLDQHL